MADTATSDGSARGCEPRSSRRLVRIAVALCLAVAFGIGLAIAPRSVDFPVYYRAAAAWRAHLPFYGPRSVLRWPMYYRYPPVFLILFAPLLALPMRWAGALWLAGKLAALLAVAGAFAHRFGWPRLARPAAPWIAAVLLAVPYLVLEFRYGNVEFYVVALCAAAFLLAEERPGWAGALLGLGIAIKVWPLFFVPYWLLTRRRRPAFAALAAALLLTAAPALVFGWAGNLHLLRAWVSQESGTALHAGTIWYPSQSLRGVLSRALAWSPAALTRLWLPLDLAAYLGFLALAWRRRLHRPSALAASALGTDAAAFCLLALLAPFTHVEDLVLLFWPALALGALLSRRQPPFAPLARVLCWIAALLSGLIPLVPGSAAQHWLERHGADFIFVAVLAAGLLLPQRENAAGTAAPASD